MDINQEANGMREDLEEFRRALHQCPETAFHEMMTMEYIREHLEQWGISYRLLDPTGIIAAVGSGDKETIALRADMDALEVEEETGLDFASLNHGCMHACAHDGHTAILMAAAKILKQHEKELNRRILLLFQPAEEIAQGAKMLLKTGLLEDVTKIFGLHIFSGIPAGRISLEPGRRMAATNWFSIRITGKSGHAGKPHECADAAVAASSLVINLQNIISRNLDPLEPAVLTIGKMTAGTARNVIAGEALLEGTVRTFSREAQELVQRRMKEIAQAAEKMYQTEISVDFQPSSHPALVNSEEVVSQVLKGAQDVFEPWEWVKLPAMMLGEDFANYLEKMDGCFAFVGGGEGYPNHHEQFDFNEDALVAGLRLMLVFAYV